MSTGRTSATAAVALRALRHRRIAREIDLVRSAVALVASGASKRVTVTGLEFGRLLMTDTRWLDEPDGVIVHALPAQLEEAWAIVVEERVAAAALPEAIPA